MTQLVVKNSEIALYGEPGLAAIEKLELRHQKYIVALNSTKIADMDAASAGSVIYQTIKSAEFDSGLTKHNDDDLIVLAKTTYDLIMDRYKNLTTEEFKTACKSGVIENYGDWYGISLKSIAQWIKGYMGDEGRVKAIKEWMAKIEPKTSAQTVAAHIEFKKESAVRAFETYKSRGTLPLGAFAYYDLINELIGVEYKGFKTLIADPDQRRKIHQDTVDELNKHGAKEVGLAESRGNVESSEALLKVMSSGWKNNMDTALKSAFLKAFFDNLIKNNKPLQL